jgi:hypothetical protein
MVAPHSAWTPPPLRCVTEVGGDDRGVGTGLGGCSLGEHASAIENVHVVADGGDHAHVVFDGQDGDAETLAKVEEEVAEAVGSVL